MFCLSELILTHIFYSHRITVFHCFNLYIYYMKKMLISTMCVYCYTFLSISIILYCTIPYYKISTIKCNIFKFQNQNALMLPK